MDSKRLTAEEVAERTSVGWLQARCAALEQRVVELERALGPFASQWRMYMVNGVGIMPDVAHFYRAAAKALADGERG